MHGAASDSSTLTNVNGNVQAGGQCIEQPEASKIAALSPRDSMDQHVGNYSRRFNCNSQYLILHGGERPPLSPIIESPSSEHAPAAFGDGPSPTTHLDSQTIHHFESLKDGSLGQDYVLVNNPSLTSYTMQQIHGSVAMLSGAGTTSSTRIVNNQLIQNPESSESERHMHCRTSLLDNNKRSLSLPSNDPSNDPALSSEASTPSRKSLTIDSEIDSLFLAPPSTHASRSTLTLVN